MRSGEFVSNGDGVPVWEDETVLERMEGWMPSNVNVLNGTEPDS